MKEKDLYYALEFGIDGENIVFWNGKDNIVNWVPGGWS